MKTLNQFVEQAVTKHIPPTPPAAQLAAGVQPILPESTANDIIDDVIKAIQEFWRQVEELECMLLGLRPDSEISVKSKVSDTCTLVYIIRKE